MALRVAVLSAELGAGMTRDLDRIFGPKPPASDAKALRSFISQGEFWLSLLTACGIEHGEMKDVTLAEVAQRISGKRAIAVVNEAGFLNRMRSL